MNNDMACGELTLLVKSTIQMRYQLIPDVIHIWDTIKTDLEKVITSRRAVQYVQTHLMLTRVRSLRDTM